MILEAGCKILVSHRRLFENDTPRYFLGVVDAYESGMMRVSGYTWIRDQIAGTYLRKPDIRTKIFSIVSGTLIVYQLPNNVNVESAKFERSTDRLWLVDAGTFKMDLSESEYPKFARKPAK